MYTPQSGDIFINKDRKNIQFATSRYDETNTRTFSLQPNTWYIAGENLTIGDVVSIQATGSIGSKTPIILKTDSTTVNQLVGIVTRTVNIGDAVDVADRGRFKFSSNVFINSDIGKVAYVSNTAGGLTTDQTQAVLGNDNLLKVGVVIDEDEIQIDIQGDGRGVIDFAQFEFILGENVDTSGSYIPKLMAMSNVDGKVYLSSKQNDQNKNRIVGFLIGSESNWGGTVTTNTRVLVQYSGLLGNFSGLFTGEPVYASGNSSTFGIITQNIADVDPNIDSLNYLGRAYDATSILVDIQPTRFYEQTEPIRVGTIIESPDNVTPDYGFVLCDYLLLDYNSDPEYTELFNTIGQAYGGTGTEFRTPNLNASGPPYYQMRYLAPYQYNPITPLMFKIETDWEVWGTGFNYKYLNLSSLQGWNNNIKDIVVKLFVKIADKGNKIFEVPQGYLSINNPALTTYGWNIKEHETDPNFIEVDIHTNYITLWDNSLEEYFQLQATDEYKFVIYKAELWNRFTDADGNEKLKQLAK